MSYVYHGREGKLYKGETPDLVGMVSGITFEVDPNLIEVREHGSRTVAEWKAGDLAITGTIERMWYEKAFLDEVKADAPAEFTLVLTATREDTGVETDLTLTGVVFSSLSIEWSADDMTSESVDFSAKEIA